MSDNISGPHILILKGGGASNPSHVWVTALEASEDTTWGRCLRQNFQHRREKPPCASDQKTRRRISWRSTQTSEAPGDFRKSPPGLNPLPDVCVQALSFGRSSGYGTCRNLWSGRFQTERAGSPSASNILGMSRYFSATSKAVFRLVMGSSCQQKVVDKSLGDNREKQTRTKREEPTFRSFA